jgi:galactokinase
MYFEAKQFHIRNDILSTSLAHITNTLLSNVHITRVYSKRSEKCHTALKHILNPSHLQTSADIWTLIATCQVNINSCCTMHVLSELHSKWRRHSVSEKQLQLSYHVDPDLLLQQHKNYNQSRN